MITDQIGLHAVLLPILINFGEALIMKRIHQKPLCTILTRLNLSP